MASAHNEVFACSCGGVGKVTHSSIQRADKIFLGVPYHVGQATDIEEHYLSYRFSVTVVWKGDIPEDFNVLSYSSSSCGYDFEVGVEYLVYLRDRHEGFDVARLCQGTKIAYRALLDRYLLGLPIRDYSSSYEVVSLEYLYSLLNTEQSYHAAEALGQLDTQAETISPILSEFALGYRPGDSKAAIQAIGMLGDLAYSSLSDLFTIYNKDYRYLPEIRAEALRSLYFVARNDRHVRNLVSAALSDTTWQIRAAAALPAVHIIYLDDLDYRDRMVTRYFRNLNDDNANVRKETLRCLRSVRRLVKRARPRLEVLAVDPDPDVRESAERLLKDMKRW